jgi:hypothetical protein
MFSGVAFFSDRTENDFIGDLRTTGQYQMFNGAKEIFDTFARNVTVVRHV